MPETPQIKTGGIPLSVLQIFLPILTAGIIAYGAAKSAAGEQMGKNDEMMRSIEANRREIEAIRAATISKDQFELLMKLIDGIKQDQMEIKTDLREIRRDARK